MPSPRLLILLSGLSVLFASASPSLGGQTIWPHPDSTLTGGWLQTVWHQEHPFNARCPWDADRQSRCLAGCVAVAMAQLINYHHDATRLRPIWFITFFSEASKRPEESPKTLIWSGIFRAA